MTLQQKIEATAAEIKKLMAAGRTDLDALAARVDELSTMQKQAAKPPARLVDLLENNEDLNIFRKGNSSRAFVEIEGSDADHLLQKTALTESGVGFGTTGVLVADRLVGITNEPRQVLTLENVLAHDVTTASSIDFVKAVSVAPGAVAQTETADLGEDAMVFTSASERIQAIGAWLPASRQIVEDYVALAEFVRNTLAYYTNLAVELQLLSGSGVDPDLHGLIVQAALADQTLLPMSGWNMLDSVSAAAEQIGLAKEIPATFVVLNSADWGKARRAKDAMGQYVYGEPSEDASTLFGLQVVPTTSITSGHFLVGSSSPAAAQVVDRQQVTIEIARSHASYFVANKVAIKVLRRLALVVRRPGSFVYGSFASSPAS